MERLRRLHESLRFRAVLVGVAVEFGLLLIIWLLFMSYGSGWLPGDGSPFAPIALLLLFQVFQVLPWLVGGAAAGFLSAGTRRRSGMNGGASGFAAGFVLGLAVGLLAVAGAEFVQPPTGLAGQLRMLVVPLVFGVGLGLLLSLVGAVGGLLGFAVRQRTR